MLLAPWPKATPTKNPYAIAIAAAKAAKAAGWKLGKPKKPKSYYPLIMYRSPNDYVFTPGPPPSSLAYPIPGLMQEGVDTGMMQTGMEVGNALPPGWDGPPPPGANGEGLSGYQVEVMSTPGPPPMMQQGFVPGAMGGDSQQNPPFIPGGMSAVSMQQQLGSYQDQPGPDPEQTAWEDGIDEFDEDDEEGDENPYEDHHAPHPLPKEVEELANAVPPAPGAQEPPPPPLPMSFMQMPGLDVAPPPVPSEAALEPVKTEETTTRPSVEDEPSVVQSSAVEGALASGELGQAITELADEVSPAEQGFPDGDVNGGGGGCVIIL